MYLSIYFYFRTWILLSIVVGINGQSRSVTVNPVSVNAGEDALMTCDYTIDAGTSVAFLTWQEVDSGGEEIGNVIVSKTGPTTNGRFSLIDDKDLQITYVNITNEGYYRCRIIQSDSNTAADFQKLTVNYISGDVSLTDSAAPECIRNITCDGSVTGSPSPNFILYQDDKPVKTQTTLPLNYLISSSESDSGTYRCEASNTAGTVESNAIQLQYSDPNFKLEEHVTVGPNETVVVRFENENFETNDVTIEWSSEPPVDDIDNDKANFTFVAGEEDGLNYTITVNVTANCSRSTIKTQTVTVSKITTMPPGNEESSTENTITIKPDKPDEDDGDGGTGGNSKLLLILGVTFAVVIVIAGLVAFIIYINRTNSVKVCPASAMVGETALITMEIKSSNGNVKPLFTWFKCDSKGYHDDATGPIVGSEETSSGRFSCSGRGLQISEVEASDDGHYACEVKLGNKQYSSFVKLTVQDKSDEKASLTQNPEQPDGAGPGRFQAPGGELYTMVNLENKTAKPETKPAQVDLNVEGLQYADLDLTRNLPKSKKNEIHHPDAETTYASIQATQI